MGDRVDGALPVFGEVLEAFGGFEAKAANDGQGCISYGGEHLWSMAGVGSGLILAACDVANVMQPVLDTPVAARQPQKLVRTSLVGGQTCNGVDGFSAFLAANDTLTGNAANLRETGPGWAQERGQRRGCFQPPDLNPAMAFLDRLRASKIRRRRPYLRGGKRARRPARYRPSMPAGCPSR
jgi:hypothetical protein